MGKLTEEIRAARSGRGRVLGFSAALSRDRSPVRGLLVAAREGTANGADVQIRAVQSLDVDALRSLVESAGDAPLGIEAPALTRAAMTAAQESGVDFLIFDPQDAAADALLSKTLDYAVRLNAGADDSQLRVIGSLRAALIVVPAIAEPLSVQAMLDLRRIAMLTAAPLATTVAASASSELLECLRNSGVAMVVLDSPGEAQVQVLQERIAALPKPSRQREEADSVTLPSLTAAPGEEEEEEPD